MKRRTALKLLSTLAALAPTRSLALPQFEAKHNNQTLLWGNTELAYYVGIGVTGTRLVSLLPHIARAATPERESHPIDWLTLSSGHPEFSFSETAGPWLVNLIYDQNECGFSTARKLIDAQKDVLVQHVICTDTADSSIVTSIPLKENEIITLVPQDSVNKAMENPCAQKSFGNADTYKAWLLKSLLTIYDSTGLFSLDVSDLRNIFGGETTRIGFSFSTQRDYKDIANSALDMVEKSRKSLNKSRGVLISVGGSHQITMEDFDDALLVALDRSGEDTDFISKFWVTDVNDYYRWVFAIA